MLCNAIFLLQVLKDGNVGSSSGRGWGLISAFAVPHCEHKKQVENVKRREFLFWQDGRGPDMSYWLWCFLYMFSRVVRIVTQSCWIPINLRLRRVSIYSLLSSPSFCLVLKLSLVLPPPHCLFGLRSVQSLCLSSPFCLALRSVQSFTQSLVHGSI